MIGANMIKIVIVIVVLFSIFTDAATVNAAEKDVSREAKGKALVEKGFEKKI